MSSLSLLRSYRSARRAPRGRGLVALFALLVGCGNELVDGDLDMEVEFLCPTDRLNSQQLHLIIHEGSCAGTEVYSQLLAHGQLAEPSNELKPGKYGFEAILVQDGAEVAQDCVMSTLPARRTIKLSLATDNCKSMPALQMPTTPVVNNPGNNGNNGNGTTGPDTPITPTDAGVSKPVDGSVTSTPTTPTTPTGTGCPNGCGTNQVCSNGVCKADEATSNCTKQTFQGREYLFCNDRMTWPSARRKCRSLGKGLVSIDSAEENDFVRVNAGGVDRWIGANDLGQNDVLPYVDFKFDFSEGIPLGVDTSCVLGSGPVGEGNWAWSSRSNDTTNERALCSFADATATTCTPVEGAYNNWAQNQPDNAGCVCVGACLEGQDCAIMRSANNGTWDDATCGTVYAAFVCEAP